MTIKTRFPSIEPSLDLNFAATKRLDPRITFTRASSATFINEDGLIEAAGVNQARFDHAPTTGESLGLLVEEARTNLLLRSEELDNASWTKASATITANESTAPDGTTTADLWTNTNSPGTVSQNYTKDATARTYSGSIWVKSSVTAFTLALDSGSNTNRGRAIFNFATGVLTTVDSVGTFTNTSGTITAYPDSWYRVTVTTTTSTATTVRFITFFSNTGATARIWGAQLEENAAFATSYIPTVAATVTRAADVASITGTNFSSWYNQSEGTFFVDSNQASVTGTLRIISANDNTSTNRINLTRSSSSGGNINFVVTNAGTNQVNGVILGSSLAAGTSNKVAAGYKAADFGGSVNGLTSVTQSTGTVPSSLTQLTIANGDALGVTPVNGTIKRITYWATRLANTTFQQITQ